MGRPARPGTLPTAVTCGCEKQSTQGSRRARGGRATGGRPLRPDHDTPWQGSKQIMDENHQPIYYTEEWHETSTGDIIAFQDHHFGHQKPGEPGHQPAYIHVRPFDNTRNGQIPGTEEHYYYDRSLG
ncbi:HNH/endonuclease VII fold putative polymorphic toxin [Streptomyces anulatus]|uniref:HNH/endonuclease VII fold putative polymorphic toxin n=1 Tax=Streptomyces anulatus TaxID=1892 RepID=UPI00386A9CFA